MAKKAAKTTTAAQPVKGWPLFLVQIRSTPNRTAVR
jgi:hypothetical protein